MSFTLFLLGAKAVSDVASGIKGLKSSKKLANEKRKTLEKFNQYNNKQLEDSYKKAFSNAMSKYIDNRLQIADDFSKAQTALNIEASSANVNLSDSSYIEDINNTLDKEFNDEIQNAYTNLTNQVADLVVNKGITQMQLSQQYNQQMNSINNALYKVQNDIYNKMGQSIMNLAFEGANTYRANQAKSKIKSKNNLSDFTNFEL